jgi:lipoprotein NlpI
MLFAVCGAAATGYDEFSRGVNATNRGEADTAIAAYSAAISAGDLPSAYMPTAYMGRARAYLRKGKCEQALADLTEYDKLKPDDAQSYALRAGADLCLHKMDDAQASFAAAIRLRPTAILYEEYASLQWNLGLFAKAAENYAHAFDLVAKDNQHRPYLVIWYAMSADRAGTLDQATLDKAKLGSDWPVPLVELYRGRTTVEKVFRAAADSDAQIAINQKCEADFYVAEWQLARNNREAAKPLLDQAVSECPHNFVEYFAAQTELKRKA